MACGRSLAIAMISLLVFVAVSVPSWVESEEMQWFQEHRIVIEANKPYVSHVGSSARWYAIFHHAPGASKPTVALLVTGDSGLSNASCAAKSNTSSPHLPSDLNQARKWVACKLHTEAATDWEQNRESELSAFAKEKGLSPMALVDGRIEKVRSELTTQVATERQSLEAIMLEVRDVLLMRIQGIPLELTTDDVVYGVLRQRLIGDLEAAYKMEKKP